MSTLARKKREFVQREELILETARRLLLEVGYLELTMDLIARKIEYSKGTIYQHFSSKEEILLNAHIKTAKIMVIAISDPASSRRALKLAKELNPNIRVIVRTRFMRETDDLIKIGAHIVIPEEFETSIQIFRKVLEQYHIPLILLFSR